MPYRAEWFIRYQVIDARVWGQVTIEDLEEHSRYRSEMLAEAQLQAPGRPVHLLYDASEAENHPPIYLHVNQAMPVLRSQNRGPTYLVTQNPEIRSIFDLASHVLNYTLYTFDTRQKAIEALEVALAKDEFYTLL